MTEKQIKDAIGWAKKEKENGSEYSVTYLVREYFNKNEIQYETFSYDDLKPQLSTK